MANYEFFYEGAPYSLEPTYGEFFTGYRLAPYRVGAPTSIQTANQIQEVSKLLNQGIRTIELQPLGRDVFDTIPKQHLKEIQRLSKLTGVEPTFHAPIIDPAGFTQEGWSETNRELAEKQFKDIVERAAEISPNGNMPITIHASALPGTAYWEVKEENGKKVLKPKQIVAVDQETGRMIPLEERKFYEPSTEEEEVHTAIERMQNLNLMHWEQELSNLAYYRSRAEENFEKSLNILGNKIKEDGSLAVPVSELSPVERRAYERLMNSMIMLENARLHYKSLYDEMRRCIDKEKLERLPSELKEEIKKNFDLIKREWQHLRKDMLEVEKKPVKAVEISERLGNLMQATNQITTILSTKGVLQKFVPVEEFAKDKAATTIANVALHAYEKFKDKAPIISIENLYPGMAFSRAQDVKELVENARKKFIAEAEKRGIDRRKAEEMAKKMIGVTWDVGHLNMMRRAGLSERDIIEQTKVIAPYVKHVHLTDNFGYSDTHLPPGMGNVPTKEILEELEKQGFTGKTVVEAGGFVQHFQRSPHPYVLEALGSPVYGMMMAPYWNQIANAYPGYFFGMGPILPEYHFSTLYGSGFASLPIELGGQMPGTRSRVTGTPMQ